MYGLFNLLSLYMYLHTSWVFPLKKRQIKDGIKSTLPGPRQAHGLAGSTVDRPNISVCFNVELQPIVIVRSIQAISGRIYGPRASMGAWAPIRAERPTGLEHERTENNLLPSSNCHRNRRKGSPASGNPPRRGAQQSSSMRRSSHR